MRARCVVVRHTAPVAHSESDPPDVFKSDAMRLPARPLARGQARPSPRRRVLGVRELVLLAIALTLLALSPTFAGIGRSRAPAPVPQWRPAGARTVELPANSFPGAAFYYLDNASSATLPPSRAVAAADGMAGDGIAPPFGQPRPLIIPTSSPAYPRALKCMTDAIYYEAATEPDAGQQAIAQVILNRVRHPAFPDSVCGVVYQGSDRASGCQFSFACDGALAHPPSRTWWLRAEQVAMRALAGAVYAPVGLATHYHTAAVHPLWDQSMTMVGAIGAHRFYRWNGVAGMPGAFFARYAGVEPLPGPLPRSALPSPVVDPIMLARQFEAQYRAGLARARAEYTVARANTPTLAPTSVALVEAAAQSDPVEAVPGGAGSIRSEYQASGSWKADPAG